MGTNDLGMDIKGWFYLFISPETKAASHPPMVVSVLVLDFEKKRTIIKRDIDGDDGRKGRSHNKHVALEPSSFSVIFYVVPPVEKAVQPVSDLVSSFVLNLVYKTDQVPKG